MGCSVGHTSCVLLSVSRWSFFKWPLASDPESSWPVSPLCFVGPKEATLPITEDLHSLHPGALLYRAAAAPPSLPVMADALAHGADVNWVNVAHESRTPLLQAVAAVSLVVIVGGREGERQGITRTCSPSPMALCVYPEFAAGL